MSTAKPKAMTKSQVKQTVADRTGLSATQTAEVLDVLENLIVEQVQTVGSFQLGSLLKVEKKLKKATPEKEMKSPLTGKQITVPAKPEHNVVKIRALKSLKDAIT